MILVHMLFLCIAIYICIACVVFDVLLLYVYIAYQHNQCMFSFIFTLHNCFCIASVFFCGMQFTVVSMSSILYWTVRRVVRH